MPRDAHSSFGGRGDVTRTDRGDYRTLRQSPDELLVELRGEQLVGQALLTRQPLASQASDSKEAQRWKFKFTSDRSAMGSPLGRGAPGEEGPGE